MLDTLPPLEREPDWEALRAPFPEFEIGWNLEGRSPDRQRGRVRATVGPVSVLERLDASVGPGGWSQSLEVASQAPPAVRCRLRVGTIERDAIESGASLSEAAERALVRAAHAFGIGRYLARLPLYWVRLDESGAPSETPSLPAWATPAAVPAGARERTPERDRIDAVLDRLRSAGLGRQAAVVVGRYGGYGRTPDDARRLHAELAAMLHAGAAGRPDADEGGR